MHKLLRKRQLTPNISLAQWQEHFQSLLQTSHGGEEIDLPPPVDTIMEPPDYCDITDRPVSIDEIQEAIKHINRNKVSGWDGIPGKVLKNVNIAQFLEQLSQCSL